MVDFCVLTGDLVSSSTLSSSQIDTAIAALDRGAGEITSWNSGLVTGFARSSGDGWQFALSPPQLGLRAALYLRSVLRRQGKNFASRIALASGPGTLPASHDPNSASGPAFTDSGRLLSTLSGSYATMAHASGGALAAATGLADHISQGWTPAQARAMAEMLPPDPGTHAEAASRLGISRQAVDQALTAAGYHALRDALDALESSP